MILEEAFMIYNGKRKVLCLDVGNNGKKHAKIKPNGENSNSIIKAFF
jgi:hypothetical protein